MWSSQRILLPVDPPPPPSPSGSTHTRRNGPLLESGLLYLYDS
jgi:hypothetical protein